MARGGIELDGHVFRRITVVVNRASGRVGPDAAEQARTIFREAGLEPRIETPEPTELEACLKAAHAGRPDLLITIAGDGTARAAASIVGPKGAVLAPLPGGTMNMLSHALYGQRDWKSALRAVLEEGVVLPVGGGSISGQAFYVAAVLGAPALWARAREAAREGRLTEALQRSRRALARTFSGRLRYSLNDGPTERAEALMLITPLISPMLRDEAPAMEAAALDPAGALDIFRMAAGALTGGWRFDPAVTTRLARNGRAFAAGPIPAILDGEPVRLGREVDIRLHPNAFRALALPREERGR
ncbi:MAG TPA: diacylglycerol kinase family protein [Caulobacteraceae bacterium]|nr:diacylglycerol kinase family protein [Caulobacteraceae bacterium]